jgi:hypothetical protein
VDPFSYNSRFGCHPDCWWSRTFALNPETEAQLLGPRFVDAELASAHGPDLVRRLSMARKHALAFSPVRLADAGADNLLSDRVASLADQDEAEPITDWQIYFFHHNREIFLLFALVFPIDLIDTALKGFEHFRAKGRFTPRR